MPFIVCVLQGYRKRSPILELLPKLFLEINEQLFSDLAVFLFDHQHFLFDNTDPQWWCQPSLWKDAAEGQGYCAVKMPTNADEIKTVLAKYATSEKIVKWLCRQYGESGFDDDWCESWCFEIREINP